MNKIHITLFGIILIFSSCFKYPEIDYNYQNYNRVVGKDGGTITFYSNYSNDSAFYLNGADSSSDILELIVPAGALDTDIVFNFYQYQDINTALELLKGLSKVGSKFYYLVPVYYSDGYHEHDDADLTYHLSLKFNKPVTVKYYFKSTNSLNTIDEKKLQFEFYDRANINYRLYRLKIPEIDQWGNRNIFVRWNQQGYPIGYNSTDINDIILGLWYPFSDADEYKTSLTNWEQVDNLTFNADNSVSFEIESTDYIYVIAQVINIPFESLPLKIVNYVHSIWNTNIDRAAFIDQQFQIILENGYLLYFERNGDFAFAEKYNLNSNDIPNNIFSYINANFAGQSIKTNLVKILPSIPNSILQYSITLTNNTALLFTGDSSSVTYSGKIVYGFDVQSLSTDIKTFIYSNFADAQILNIIYNDIASDKYYAVYIKYNNRNAKVYFDDAGSYLYTVYYGLKQTEISAEVTNYLKLKFPDIDLVSIDLVYSTDSSFYNIQLLNSAYLQMSETAELYYADYYVKLNQIPSQLIDTIDKRFNSNQIVESYYHFENNQGRYYIGFQEQLNISSTENGEIIKAEGRNFLDLPPSARNYIKNNYGEQNFADFFYAYDNSTSVYRYTFHATLKDGTILLFDRNGNFIQFGKSSSVKKFKLLKRIPTKPDIF